VEEVQITIIGAGVVGLALAAELSRDWTVYLLEKNESFGLETSTRNSGVIHAGIYYPGGSLKARLCVEGNAMLHQLCAANSIPHRKLGKLIVATKEAELGDLQALWQTGTGNGADLRMVSTADVRKLEPNVNAVGGILSPSTSIVDGYSLMRYFSSLAASQGAGIAYKSRVTGLDNKGGAWRVTVEDSSGAFQYQSRVVVNSAGLWSDRVAELAGIDVDAARYSLRYCKGQYFSLGKRLAGRLVYPVPHHNDAGLGIHVTPDIEGRLRLGPDTEYVTDMCYSVDETRKKAFCDSARNIIPSIDYEDLQPDFAGIRPKLQGPGEGFRDFVIRHEADRGLAGLVNLIGIESPGLTASPAIARYVRGIVSQIL